MPLQYRKTITVSASDVDGIAAAQLVVEPDSFVLTNTVLPNGGQRPSITSDGDETTVNFVFVGTDIAGNVITQTVAGPNATTLALDDTWATITSVTPDDDTVGNVSIGWVAIADMLPLPLNLYGTPFNVSLTLQNFSGAGTPAATVLFTQDDLTDPTLGPLTYTWFEHATLVAQTAAGTGNFSFPVAGTACVLDGNDDDASVEFIVLQATGN